MQSGLLLAFRVGKGVTSPEGRESGNNGLEFKLQNHLGQYLLPFQLPGLSQPLYFVGLTAVSIGLYKLHLRTMIRSFM